MKRRLPIILACALLTACGSPAASSAATSSPAASGSAAASSEVSPAVSSAVSSAVSEPEVSTPAAEERPEEIRVEMEFTGTVLALTPTTILVEVDEECDLHKTSNQVVFSTKGLEAIEIEEGGRVWVGCGANIRETYPAQVDALTWAALPSESAEPKLSSTLVIYDASGDAMSVTLPTDWEYEQEDILEVPVEAEPETDPEAESAAEPAVLGHVIAFWPASDPACRVRLMVEQAAPIIDINAVTAVERTFPKAGTATVYTQEHDDGGWIYVQFATEDGRYSVRWAPTADQKAAYEETFWTILDTVAVGNEV